MKTTPEMIAQMEAPITKYERSDSTEKRCVAAAFRLLIADLEKARCRIHDLETICDPARLTIENALSKDQIAALQIMYRKAADELAATKVRLEEATATRGSSVLVPAPKLEEMQAAELRALRKQLAEAQALLKRPSPLMINAWYVGANAEIQRALRDVRIDLVRLDTSALDAAIAEAVEPYRKDAERYRWLTNDHDSPNTREACRDISARIPVMSYSAASQAIDAAIAANGGKI